MVSRLMVSRLANRQAAASTLLITCTEELRTIIAVKPERTRQGNLLKLH